MAKEEIKENFLLKCSLVNRTKRMTADQKAQFLDDVLSYANGNAVDLDSRDSLVAVVLEEVFEYMDWNAQRYARISKARSEAGKKGASVTNEKRWGSQQQSANGQQQSANGQQQSHDIDIENDVDIENDIDRKPTKKPSVVENRFGEFWKAYPKKRARGAAEKAFKKIAPGEDLQKRIIEAIEAQKKSAEWQKDAGQYIPYPATWLNQRRWEDEEREACTNDNSGSDRNNKEVFGTFL